MHEARRQRIDTERLVGDAVVAEAGVPLDYAAVHLVRFRHGQAQAGVAVQQPGHGPALAPAGQPDGVIAGRQGGLQRMAFLLAQWTGAERAALHAAVLDGRGQRVGFAAGRGGEGDVEGGPVLRRVGPAPRLHGQAEDAGGAGHGFQQGAQRHLAGMAVEVVDAVRARVEAMHDEVAGVDDLEAPRLGVVAAGRPAGQVEDVCQRGVERIHGWPLGWLRRTSAMARRCSGWRLPPGRQVRTRRLR